MITKYIFLKNISIFILIINFIFPNVYQGLSISESDNLDALYNPAGLGIDHGWETFIYGIFNQDDFENGTLYFGDKIKGWGYSLGYQKIDKISKPSQYNFGYGTKLKKDLYLGISYNQDELYQIGTLYRPYNFLSSGLKYTTDNNLDFGFALRPFNNHRITLGTDLKFDLDAIENLEPTEYSLFIKLISSNGLELTTKFLKNDGDLSNGELFNSVNIDLGFNFGKNNLKTSYNTSNENEMSLGWMRSSHNKEIKLKEKSNYVSLILDDLFIEEKPMIPKFEIDLFNLNQSKGTQLRIWIEKIDNLTKDSNIEGLVIYLKNVGAGLAKRNEIRNALKRFKASGKKIIVYSENTISNINYHLISLADEIYVNPLTGVDLRGLKMEVTFYRGLLDSLDITPKVWRISKDGKSYKTAGDTFINTKMSDEMKENYSHLLDDFYKQFVTDIAEGRGWINPEKSDSTIFSKVDSLINEGPYWHHQQALNAGLFNYKKDTMTYLIDGAFYPDEFQAYIKKLNDSKIIKFKDTYKTKKYNYAWKEKDKSKIAMIYAVGGIISGRSNPGARGSTTMGDKTIMKAIKSARNDDSIEAIILRIDSGGGSALASDQMWREIYKTTVDTSVVNKKPFIASMSDVAASGGYYIACQADTIIAYPTTVTGSIGVISMGFNLSDLYQKIGINSEVIKRGEYSDLLTQSRQWTTEEDSLMIVSVENYYNEFTDRVLRGRVSFNNDRDELDKVAIGRVWSGTEALNNGLIDEVGGINETINIAKKMIGLDEEDEIEIVEYPLPFDKNSFKSNSNFNSTDELEAILKLMPESIKQELNNLNIIPILKGERLYFILPYHIDIN